MSEPNYAEYHTSSNKKLDILSSFIHTLAVRSERTISEAVGAEEGFDPFYSSYAITSDKYRVYLLVDVIIEVTDLLPEIPVTMKELYKLFQSTVHTGAVLIGIPSEADSITLVSKYPNRLMRVDVYKVPETEEEITGYLKEVEVGGVESLDSTGWGKPIKALLAQFLNYVYEGGCH